MNHKIKIAVIGGTGKSGKYLVQELIAQSFPIKLLLRIRPHFKLSIHWLKSFPEMLQITNV